MSDSEREEFDCQKRYDECHREYEEEYVCRECRKKERPCYRNGTAIAGNECFRCGQRNPPVTIQQPSGIPIFNWGTASPV